MSHAKIDKVGENPRSHDSGSHSEVASDATPSLDDVLSSRDECAWRGFVSYYDSRLRAVVHHASEATASPLREDEVDDVLGDFWLLVVADDQRLLRRFDPKRGSDLLTWLTFHVAQIV